MADNTTTKLEHNLPPDERRCTARSKSAMRRRELEELRNQIANGEVDPDSLSPEELSRLTEEEAIQNHWEYIDDRCPMWAIRGGTVCYHHGGANPVVRAKAQERLRVQKIEAHATKVLATEGLAGIEDPLTELSKMASSSQALMLSLGARVNSLQELEHFDAKNSPTIKAEVQMYERAMDRTARLLESLVKAGYTERQVQIQENEAMLVAGVLKRTIAALGLTPQQQAQAQVILAEEFRELAPRPLPGREANNR